MTRHPARPTTTWSRRVPSHVRERSPCRCTPASRAWWDWRWSPSSWSWPRRGTRCRPSPCPWWRSRSGWPSERSGPSRSRAATPPLERHDLDHLRGRPGALGPAVGGSCSCTCGGGPGRPPQRPPPDAGALQRRASTRCRVLAARVAFCLLDRGPVLRRVPAALSRRRPAGRPAWPASVFARSTNHLLVGVVVALASGQPLARAEARGPPLHAGDQRRARRSRARSPALVVDPAVWMLPLVLLPDRRRAAQRADGRARERQALRDPLTGLATATSLQLRLGRGADSPGAAVRPGDAGRRPRPLQGRQRQPRPRRRRHAAACEVAARRPCAPS